jgi:hypothetical protein
MVDDYAGYKKLFDRGVVELGCWALARRKFHDLHAANRSPIAAEALTRIATLYAIEAEAREAGLDREALHALRQDLAKPQVEAFKAWLDGKRPVTTPCPHPSATARSRALLKESRGGTGIETVGVVEAGGGIRAQRPVAAGVVRGAWLERVVAGRLALPSAA